MQDWLVKLLCCPETKLGFSFIENNLVRSDGVLFSAQDEIFSLVYPNILSGDNEKLTGLYEKIAPYYDFTERFLGWLLTGVKMKRGREEIVSLCRFESSMRLLEVSPGPGVFTELLREKVGKQGEIVSVDLSLNMLKQCKRTTSVTHAELLRANAEYLPFYDNTFDAIFHMGGVNLFNQPVKALNEFVRVTKPNGIIAFGDEEMSKNFSHPLGRYFLPKMNPGFLRKPPEIPSGMIDNQKYEVYRGLAYLNVGRKCS